MYNFIKKCPVCGQPLYNEDVDYNFNGNQNEYSECQHCHIFFVFYIRYGKLWKYEKTKETFSTIMKIKKQFMFIKETENETR